MNEPILQGHLSDAPWMHDAMWRLPGIQPLDVSNWLIRDDAFAPQMALRDDLVATRAADVLATVDRARDATDECLDLVLATLADDPGYRVGAGRVTRPDGETVEIDRARSLATLARLVQEDMCLMQRHGDEHVLTAAALCFPASWTLAEKIGRPLVRIHRTVDRYDSGLAKRVQRMFDAIRPERPLWRMNAFLYDAPDLFAPRREDAPPRSLGPNSQYLRAERQTLRRLPKTQAVVFTIHTYVVARTNLSDAQQAGLDAAFADAD